MDLIRYFLFLPSTTTSMVLWAFFIVMMSVVGVGTWCLYTGKNIAGLTALVTAVAGPVTAFIYGRYRQSKEREAKK